MDDHGSPGASSHIAPMRLLTGSNNVYVETAYRGVVMIESLMRPTDAVSWKVQVHDKGEIIYLIHTEGHHDHVLGDCRKARVASIK